jgi:hypothetical protein
MKKLTFHKPTLELTVISKHGGKILLFLLFVGIFLSLWFGYVQWYVPIQSTDFPQDKLTQKQEKINVKSFEEVQQKWQEKQKIITPQKQNELIFR